MAAISKAEIWLLFCLKTVCCTLGSWWPTSRWITAWIWAKVVPGWAGLRWAHSTLSTVSLCGPMPEVSCEISFLLTRLKAAVLSSMVVISSSLRILPS